MKLSVILPIYNEEESVAELYREIKAVLGSLSFDYEIIAVNDGSKDKSFEVIKEIAAQDYNFKVINFRRNCGQTAAISAGIDFSSGEILIPMDADLQNDPADIPKFLEKINEGFDAVSGWRKDRKDAFSRRLPSKIANLLISFVTKVKLHDYGCTLRAYKNEAIKDLRFYGEMHRFMPAYVVLAGAKMSEITVNHRPRKYGKAKYGLRRTFKVLLDLLTVKFFMAYSAKPMHFFGQVGLFFLFAGFLSGAAAVIYKFAFQPTVLAALFIVAGIQFILTGLLAEILIRIYYESGRKSHYSIKEKINF